MFNTIQDKISDLKFFGIRDTSVTTAINMAVLFKLKDACVFVNYQYSKFGEYQD